VTGQPTQYGKPVVSTHDAWSLDLPNLRPEWGYAE